MGVVVTMDRRIAGVEEIRVQDAAGNTALVPQSLMVTLGEDQGGLPLLSKVILSKGDGQKLAARMGDRVRLRIEVIEPDTPAAKPAKDAAPSPAAPEATASTAEPASANAGAAGTDGPESGGGSGKVTALTTAKRNGRR